MTTPMQRRAHRAGETAKPAPAPRSEQDRQIDAVLHATPWITSRAQARLHIEGREAAAAEDAKDPEPAPRESDVTSGGAKIPGTLAARKQEQLQQQKVKPPKRSDYERGSNEDRAGNRGGQ